jgi:DNA-binding response OmpR family regulator
VKFARRGADRGYSMATPSAGRRRRRPLVLVVEDDGAVRQPLEKFLRLHGFDVVGAETADQALDAINTKRIDAAIVDLRLPQGSGRDVIVSIPPPAPVIIFSAVPGETDGLERMRPGTRLITKPFSLVMLVEMLNGMLPPEG